MARLGAPARRFRRASPVCESRSTLYRTAIFAVLNGRPLQSDHALLSPLFSLLSTHHFVVQNRFFVCFVFFVVSFHSGDARRNRRAGAPTRANHALPSPLFSLLSAENQIWIIFYQIFVLAVIAIVHHTGKEVREWARN